jgi:hypothetical protein
MPERIKEIYDELGLQREVIVRNNSGTFTYAVEYFSDEPLEMCWIPQESSHVGIYDTAERAEVEARAGVDWL